MGRRSRFAASFLPFVFRSPAESRIILRRFFDDDDDDEACGAKFVRVYRNDIDDRRNAPPVLAILRDYGEIRARDVRGAERNDDRVENRD